MVGKVPQLKTFCLYMLYYPRKTKAFGEAAGGFILINFSLPWLQKSTFMTHRGKIRSSHSLLKQVICDPQWSLWNTSSDSFHRLSSMALRSPLMAWPWSWNGTAWQTSHDTEITAHWQLRASKSAVIEIATKISLSLQLPYHFTANSLPGSSVRKELGIRSDILTYFLHCGFLKSKRHQWNLKGQVDTQQAKFCIQNRPTYRHAFCLICTEVFHFVLLFSSYLLASSMKRS